VRSLLSAVNIAAAALAVLDLINPLTARAATAFTTVFVVRGSLRLRWVKAG